MSTVRPASTAVIGPRGSRDNAPYRTIESANVKRSIFHPERLAGLDEDRRLEMEPVDFADERELLGGRLLPHLESMALVGGGPAGAGSNSPVDIDQPVGIAHRRRSGRPRRAHGACD